MAIRSRLFWAAVAGALLILGFAAVAVVAPNVVETPLKIVGFTTYHARSQPAGPGVDYAITVGTHCDIVADFDGTFWKVDDSRFATADGHRRADAPIGNPNQVGTITRFDHDHAFMKFPGGTLPFVRDSPTNVQRAGCA